MNPALRMCMCLMVAAPLATACEPAATDDPPTGDPPAGDPPAAAASEDHGVNVSGHGEAWATPDVLDVDVGISVVKPTVADAIDEATRRASAMLEAVGAHGVATEDVQTTGYNVGPEYSGDGGRKLVGYRVTNTVRIRIRHIERAGEILDAATQAGGNDAVVNDLAMSVSDPTPVLEQARDAAWKDAYAKAEQLARLAKLELGAPSDIREGVAMPLPIPVTAQYALAAGARATPIEAGQSKLTVDIQVVFSIASGGGSSAP